MKNLIVLIATILIASAATATDIAKYNFAFRAADGQGIHNVSAVLHDDKTLKLEVVTSHLRPDSPRRYPLPIVGWETGAGVSFTKELAAEVYSILSVDALSLSRAEIEVQVAGIVCMMMPGPTMSNNHLSVRRDYDYNTETFKGEMTLVQGPRGCWVGRKVFPKNQHDQATAARLQATIKALAIDFLMDQRL